MPNIRNDGVEMKILEKLHIHAYHVINVQNKYTNCIKCNTYLSPFFLLFFFGFHFTVKKNRFNVEVEPPLTLPMIMNVPRE